MESNLTNDLVDTNITVALHYSEFIISMCRTDSIVLCTIYSLVV